MYNSRVTESDRYVTISVTCPSYSNANDTILMLVSILPYSRLRNSKMKKEMTYHSRAGPD